MNDDAFECAVDLDSVRGGFDAGRCFDDVWPWAAGGALAGAPSGPWGAGLGALGGGGAAALASPNCGDGSRSPATMLRESLTSPTSPTGSTSSSSGTDTSLGGLGAP